MKIDAIDFFLNIFRRISLRKMIVTLNPRRLSDLENIEELHVKNLANLFLSHLLILPQAHVCDARVESGRALVGHRLIAPATTWRLCLIPFIGNCP